MSPGLRHRVPAPLIRACLAVGLAALATAGCQYFHPAAPEQPTSGTVVPIDLSSAEATLETLRQAVEAKGLSGGDVAFRACFADSPATTPMAFHAFFWPEDANTWTSQGGALPADWTLKDEGQFYNVGPRALVNLRNEPYQMTWDPDPTQPDEAHSGSWTLHRHYLVVAVGTGGVVAEIIAKGYADLIVVQVNNNWVITQWQDRADPVVDPVLIQKTWGLRRLESR